MNKYSILIIKKVILHKYLSLSQLCQDTSLTKRQLEYQLDNLNIFLKDKYQISDEKLIHFNQSIDSETVQILEQLFLNNIDCYEFSKEERQFYIFLAVLLNTDYLTLYHLTDELKASKTTIQSDLRELRQKLVPYEALILSDRYYGYRLHGETPFIRRFLIEKVNIIQDSVIRIFFKNHQISLAQDYWNAVAETASDFCISFVESRLEKFIYIIAIFSQNTSLLDNVYPATELSALSSISSLDEYRFIQCLMDKLNIHLDKTALSYVSALLIGISVSNIDINSPDKPWILELIKQILCRFQALSGLEYTDYNSALAQIYAHFRPALYRTVYDIPVCNPLTSQIMEEYSTTATLVKETLKPINYIINKEFSNDEYAYLTIHFASLSTKRVFNSIYKKKIAVICNSGTGLSVMLMKQLCNLFPEFDFFVSNFKLLVNNPNHFHCDAVFSTSLKFELDNLHLPVFYVPALLTSHDKYLISQQVYKVFANGKELLPSIHKLIAIIHKYADISSENKLRHELIKYFSQKEENNIYTKPLTLANMIAFDLIQTNIKSSSAREAIVLSAQPLLKTKCILPEYIDAIIKNFEASEHHAVIMKSVALPHASPNQGVLKPAIAVTVLETPVFFEVEPYDPVKYIFCLSAIDYDSHIDAMAKLVELLEIESFYQILDTQDPVKIYEYLNTYAK